MPVAPRPNNKAKKIAYAILGTPDNMRRQDKRKLNAIQKRILFQETYQVR